MSVPDLVTRAVIEDEFGAVASWAARRGWVAYRDCERLRLRAATYHPSGRLVEFLAELDGYPAIPPIWRVVEPGTDQPASAFPAPGSQTGVSGSIFHSNRLICAPWNQLAYKTKHDGPHDNWTMAAWQEVTGYTRATTLVDMLDQIHSTFGSALVSFDERGTPTHPTTRRTRTRPARGDIHRC